MVRIADLFFPKEKRFFEYIDKQIVILGKATKLLAALVKINRPQQKDVQEHLTEIHKYGEEIDSISREVIDFLHNTFITPIDRDEIKALSLNICLVVNAIKKIIESVSYCHVEAFDKEFLKQVAILEESVHLLKQVFEAPLAPKRNVAKFNAIKELEKKADIIYLKALGELFSTCDNAVMIIKQKDLYDVAESAIDDVRILVDVLETIVINNS